MRICDGLILQSTSKFRLTKLQVKCFYNGLSEECCWRCLHSFSFYLCSEASHLAPDVTVADLTVDRRHSSNRATVEVFTCKIVGGIETE